MAERNLARRKELDRREESKALKRTRNLKRWNVVFMVALFVIFGVFAWLPVSYGDTSDNPHQMFDEQKLQQLENDAHPLEWTADEVQIMEKKIWDGNDQFSGYIRHDLTLWGLPVDIEGVTTVPLSITLVSYRAEGATNYRIGMFPKACSQLQGEPISDLPENLRFIGAQPLMIGEPTTIEMNVPSGGYCFVFEYLEPMNDNGWKATIDAEVEANWPRPILTPVMLIFGLLSIFGFIGAQKAGKAWKEVAQPERPAARSLEDEVMDAADEERGSVSYEGPQAQTDDDESSASPTPSGPPKALTDATSLMDSMGSEADSESHPPSGPPSATPSGPPSPTPSGPPSATPSGPPSAAPAEEVTEAAAEPASAEVAEPAAESGDPATADPSEYTDEMLLGWGWTTEQIADWRAEQQGTMATDQAGGEASSEATSDPDTADRSEYTDEMLIGWGWSQEQIDDWRAGN